MIVLHHYPAEHPPRDIGPYWVWTGDDVVPSLAEWHESSNPRYPSCWMSYGVSADREGLHCEEIEHVRLWCEIPTPRIVRAQTLGGDLIEQLVGF